MAYKLEGRIFGYLEVIRKVENRFDGKHQWLCKCECGQYKVYITNMLTGSRGAKTCGACQDRLKRKDAYISWQGAKQRCRDRGCKDYPRYGGAGITFSTEWDDFKAFYKEMGDPPWDGVHKKRYSLKRIDKSKGYEPGNCKWATKPEQASNKDNLTFLGWTGYKQLKY